MTFSQPPPQHVIFVLLHGNRYGSVIEVLLRWDGARAHTLRARRRSVLLLLRLRRGGAATAAALLLVTRMRWLVLAIPRPIGARKRYQRRWALLGRGGPEVQAEVPEPEVRAAVLAVRPSAARLCRCWSLSKYLFCL